MREEGFSGADCLSDYEPHLVWLEKNRGGPFCTPGSLQWFLRQHRKELVEHGALLIRLGPGGHWISGKKFEQIALQILRRESVANV